MNMAEQFKSEMADTITHQLIAKGFSPNAISTMMGGNKPPYDDNQAEFLRQSRMIKPCQK